MKMPKLMFWPHTFLFLLTLLAVSTAVEVEFDDILDVDFSIDDTDADIVLLSQDSGQLSSQRLTDEDSGENLSEERSVRVRRQTNIRTSLTSSSDSSAPPGTSSLVFVFDITGSMYDDLVQVREGAKRIFRTVLEQREKLIHNYVLVPFHDPEVGPVVVTTDTHFYQRKLQNLYVQGGGDCPEMTISGIKMALEAALPASFVYVFTDARSKDYHLTDQVLNLIQQKQSVVVFVMTGDCGNRTHDGYLAYERIAAASSGQIFHLEKTDVSDVLIFVKQTVQVRKVNIVSLDRDMGGTFVINVPVDEHLNELTVSLSGSNPSISLIDSDGNPITTRNGLKTVLDLEEVNVVSIRDPKAGMWQLRTTSNEKHSIRVTGIGQVDFAHGFSAKTVGSIEMAHSRPVKGVESYLMINMTGLPAPGVATMASLVDLKGNILYTNPLIQDKYSPYLYSVGPFVPPDGFYFVKVNGIDDKNYEFQRISPTAISPQAAGGPKAFMQEKISGVRGEGLNLTCSVDSRARYTVYWYKGQERIGGPLFFADSAMVRWEMREVSMKDRGEYRCVVVSPAGNDSASTYLELREPVPQIIAPQNVTVLVSSDALLHCRTRYPLGAISWEKEGKDRNHTIAVSDQYRILQNGTLRISQVTFAAGGAYICKISTQGGTADARVHLTVLDVPTATVDPRNLYFVRRGSFNMSCILTGTPKPSANWYFQGRKLLGGNKYFITYKYDLIVRDAGPEDSGRYECRAEGVAGTARDFGEASLAIPPNVTVSSEREMIGRGDTITLECQILAGVPTPSITWYRGGREITAFRYITIQGGRLTIQGAQDRDAGMYSCMAANMAGRAEGRIRVDVGSIPSIIPGPATVTVNIERDITLSCRATGHPIPTVTWARDGVPVPNGGRFQLLPDGGLLIRRADLSDASRYTCTASNRFGRQDASRTLVVTGLISPVLGHVSPEEQVVLGRALRLSCVVVLGTPKPTLRWLKDGYPITSSPATRIESQGSGLILTRTTEREAGRYTCIATNAAGNASINVNVQVISKPEIAEGDLLYVVNEKNRVEIPCNATGRPNPTISWNQNGRPLILSLDNFNIKPDGTLIIYRAAVKHKGSYTCTAANAAGSSQRTVEVKVRVPPTIHPDQTNYNVIEGEDVRMSCDATGDPKPEILWYFEEEKVTWGAVGADGALTISEGEEKHRGPYKCVAMNIVGSATRLIILSVHTAPVIDGSGEVIEMTVIANETATFPCPARAEPPPSRQWTYEGRRVFRGYSYGSELRFTGEGALVITQSKIQHEGVYKCLVSNLAGNDSITYVLKVLEPPRIVSDQTAGTIDVVLNLMLEIPCRATGTPKPTISWQKDGLELLGDEIMKIDADGAIRIEHSELAHAGTYTCTATNIAGEDSRETIVVVQEPPVILPTTQTEYTSVEGDRVEMRCIASGSPAPIIKWYRRGAEIRDNRPGVQIFPETGRLILTSVSPDHHGPYLCKAINPAGVAEEPVKLTVIVPPDIPDQEVIISEEVLIGGPFSLYCPVFSTPIPEITWQLDSRPIAEGDPNIEFSEDKRRLHVLKSRTTDAGVYKCIARNPAGESSKTFAVEVLVPPNLDESKWKRKVSVITNHSATLGCPVSGTPDPDISWLANGQLLEIGPSTKGIKLSPDGKTVVIDSAQLDHEGSYTCLATNKAGQLDIDVMLTVLSPPSLGDDEVIEIVAGQMVTMNCNPRDEGLKSTITWLKDGGDAKSSEENINEALGGRRLFVMSGKLSNAGSYVCIVRNTAGESRKTFKLIVLVPPEFREKEFEQNLEVMEGHSLTLPCYVTGTPKPELTWDRNGEKVSINSVDGVEFSHDDQVLRIEKMYNGINTRFTCLAKNKAGSVSRDFFVQVIAPPVIIQSGDRTILEVIEGFSVTMECPVTVSFGQIDLQWLKDGRPITEMKANMQISLDKTRLHMVNVEKEDESDYTCIARNPAGEATRDFRLVVIIPPKIVGRMVEDITVIEGTPLNLQCDFKADPLPEVIWKKDGHQVSPRAQYLRDNATIYFPEAGKGDAGSYFCMISNTAGKTEKTFNVRVILKPTIQGENELESIIEVLVRNPMTLDCPVMDPVGVELSWLRHELPLTPEIDNMKILAGGRHLHITSARREDAGRFTCRAQNEAGSSTRKYRLVVLVPPTIIGEGGPMSVIENQTLVLPCETDGIPTPTITWVKQGADAALLPAVEVLSEGQQYRITQAAPSIHEGGYLCKAINKVGTADIGFDVDVISKPTVDQVIKDTIEVIVGNSADFRCPAIDRKYSPQTSWLRDGRPISSKGSSKYQISSSGTKLHLMDSELSDEGMYSCRVKNPAGETTVDFKLIVLDPPTILILEKDINRTVVENATVSLSCPAKGKPDPTIGWLKDGEVLDGNTIGREIPGAVITGNQIKIPKILVADGGRYTCVATNKAGSEERDISVYVMTPPRIEREGIPEEIEGLVGKRVTIPCPAYGRPPPTVTWLKAGRPLQASENIYFSASKQKLHFVSISDGDLDRYTCVATNEAGEDKRDFGLEVLVSPTIRGSNLPRNIQVIIGRSAILECPAEGSPRPTISWMKNGQPVSETGRVRILSDGRQLQVSNALLEDTARYTCIASNHVGLVDLDIFVEVVGPPVVVGADLEAIEVIETMSTNLECDIKGTEPLDMEWLKSGEALQLTGPRAAFFQISSGGRRLHILAAQTMDEGRYTCIGRNQAGEARKNFELKVLIPPVINETASSAELQTLSPGQTFRIECKVRGIPHPTITWLQDDAPFLPPPDGEVKFVYDNATIWVSRAKSEHAAKYTCIAGNKVGEARKDFTIQLQGPPRVDMGLERREVNVGEFVVLSCRVVGGGDVRVSWLVEGESVETLPPSPTVQIEDRRVTIEGARLTDAARYTCVVENDAGEAVKHFDLSVIEKPYFKDTTNLSPAIILGRPLILDCAVQGTPKPILMWTKDGVPISQAEGNFLNNGQQYQIEAAKAEDAGRYSCVAENKAGRAEKDLVVDVLLPPVMGSGQSVMEVPENETLTMVCPANAYDVTFQWSKNGIPLTTSSNIQLSSSGRKLHIMKARTSNAGRYSCVVKNEAGEASLDILVIVLVPPSIAGPGFRQAETVVNQTVQLECQTSGIPSPTLMWNLDGRPLLPSKTAEFINNGTVIRIHGIQANQEGRYTCVAVNKVGRAEADTFVNVIAPPTIAPGPPEIKVILGQGQTVRCEVEGNPTPTVEWDKNGESFRSALVHSSLSGHYIHVVEAQEEDAGRYTCIASNRAGEARRDFNLIVLTPPAIEAGERVLNVIENRTLIIECMATGSPQPQLSWLKEGQPLANGGEYQIQNGRLTVMSATTSDGGRYTCEAKNEAGKAQVDFSVDVYWRPKFRDLETDIRVIEQSRATLQCNVNSKPRAEIRWLKGGRPLNPESRNFMLSPRGDSLMILSAARTDAGSYSCVAKNPAGENEAAFTVTVLVPPHIDAQVDQNPKVITDKSIIVMCPVLGMPDPQVEWRKNGRPLEMEEGRLEVEGGKHLRIIKALHSDDARYTCHAFNEAGELDTDYALEVIAPPKFGRAGVMEYEVIQGESITMECEVEASPQPQVSWMKGDRAVYLDKNVWISRAGQELTIVQAKLTDGGRYTCKATNVAGTTNVEMILHVLVPPTIDKSNIIGNPLAIVNRSISLECPASGIPSPTVRWLKDGQPLSRRDPRMTYSGNNQTVVINNIRQTDGGRYTCIAENKAGKAEQDYNLEVLLPPRLGQQGRQTIILKEGESTTLTCPVISQNPPPAITWTKDGRPLDPLTLPNLRFSSENRRVHIASAKMSDEGLYTCIASNRAGESQLEFEVQILSPPVIDGSRNDPQPRVIIGRSQILWCMVSGRPEPIVKWLRNGAELTPQMLRSDYGLMDRNQGLRLNKAKSGDTGQFTCVAENPAGRAELDIPLDVWVPPTVSISGDQTVAPLERQILLRCQAVGNPPPVITWSKDGQALFATPSGTHINPGGTILTIPRLREQDVGRYTCTGRNDAGVAEASVDIDVLVPPVINRENLDFNPTLPARQTLTIHCEATGKPIPTLEWYHNGELLAPGQNNIQIEQDGRYLQISDVGLANKGFYKCVAKNEAGFDEIIYNVGVVEGPTIPRGGTIQVVEGNTTEIRCEAGGTPPPTIIWQRNGQRIDTRDRYFVGPQFLRIRESRSSDAGIYVCVATNQAGTAQQAYTLEVLVKPKITVFSPDSLDLGMGKPLELKCSARGYPDPDTEWYFQRSRGEELANLDGSRRHSIDGYGTLRVAALTDGDAGTYWCFAKNNAGQDNRTSVVTVISPPRSGPGGIQIINVTQGDPAKLKCEMTGSPIPNIVWYKDGGPLGSSNPSQSLMMENTVLDIGDVRLTDDGSYSCVAQNPAGNATQNFRLHVGLPPRVEEDPRRVVVSNGSRATLPCEAVAIPEPEIYWNKGGTPVSPRTREETSVVFRTATPSDAGIYTCQAKNWAGTATKNIELVVLVPPMVIPKEMNVTVKENATITMECEATGYPEPMIEWFKVPNDNPVIAQNRIVEGPKYTLMGSSLVVKNAKKEDASYYRCQAKNEAGVDSGYRVLKVDLPKKDWKTIWVECDEFGRPVMTTYVPARGDLPDDEKSLLPWKTEFQDLPENMTEGILIRCLPHRPRDPQETPGPNSPPIIVELAKNQDLKTGNTLKLTCGAIGTPTPTIIWLQNGTEMPNQPESLNGKSTIEISNINKLNQGDYTCLARNMNGQARSVALITVDRNDPPADLNIPNDSGVAPHGGGRIAAARPVAILSCESQEREGKVYWSKGDRVITTDTYVRVLRNGSLVILDPGDEYDLSRYECVKNKKIGIVSRSRTIVEERRPIVSVYPKRQEVTIGSPIYIHCRVDGDPLTTEVAWFHNQIPLHNNRRLRIHLNNTLEIRSLQDGDRGAYRCFASNGMGTSQDDAVLIIQGQPIWATWSTWTECSKSCGIGGRRYRYRYCFRDSLEVVSNQRSGDSYEFFEGSGSEENESPHQFVPALRPFRADLDSQRQGSLEGQRSEEMEWVEYDDKWVESEAECEGEQEDIGICNNFTCPSTDVPSQIEGTVRGQINGQIIGDQPIIGNVTPFVDSNQLFIRVEQLPITLSPTTRGMVGYTASPCWLMAYRNRQAMNGYKMTGGEYLQNSQYRFRTGELLNVKQTGSGLNEHGHLKLDVLVDGSVPPFPGHHMVTMDPHSEVYTQTAPGIIHGQGRSTLRIGSHYAVPFSWHHNISFNGSARMNSPAARVEVSAIDLTSENANLNGNYGYFVRVAAKPESVCPPGYTMNPQGTLCVDIDECGMGLAGCKGAQECVNFEGSYRCTGECKQGYTLLDNGTCSDLDECRLGLASCEQGTECVNSNGGYRCLEACRPGFRRTRRGQCQDIDECRENIPCHPQKACVNVMGSFKCLCRPGFKSASPSAPCEAKKNVPGTIPGHGTGVGSAAREGGGEGRTIPCPKGFVWDDGQCQDIDECALYQPCQYECHNIPSSFQCSCPPGYRVDETRLRCIDIDECAEGTAMCSEGSLCFNQRGGYRCLRSPCPDFYRLDSSTKQCILRCLEDGTECSREAKLRPPRIQIQLLSVPSGIRAQTDLLRLTAYNNLNRLLRQTRFALKNQGQYQEQYLPFSIRLDNGVGTIFSTRPLSNPAEYRLAIRATSYDSYEKSTRYQTDFLIYLSVSRFPF